MTEERKVLAGIASTLVKQAESQAAALRGTDPKNPWLRAYDYAPGAGIAQIWAVTGDDFVAPLYDDTAPPRVLILPRDEKKNSSYLHLVSAQRYSEADYKFTVLCVDAGWIINRGEGSEESERKVITCFRCESPHHQGGTGIHNYWHAQYTPDPRTPFRDIPPIAGLPPSHPTFPMPSDDGTSLLLAALKSVFGSYYRSHIYSMVGGPHYAALAAAWSKVELGGSP